MQNLKTIEKALKENYLPALNNKLGIEPSAFLAKVKKVAIKGNNIVSAAPIGLSGGFGFGEEGEATPKSGNVPFERFVEHAKDMYVDIRISQKAVKLTGPSGSMADALSTEVKGAYETARWNVGRSLFGTGSGKLATISAINAATVSTTAFTVNDTRNVKEGLIIDTYKDVSSEPTLVATARVIAVDHVNKTVTVDKASSNFTNSTYFTVQNSLNREITGLGAIMYNSSDADYTTSLYGVTKASNPYINPIITDAQSDISDGILTGVLRRAEREKNSKVNLLMAGDDAYDAYVEYLRGINVRVEAQSKEIEGGFKAIKYHFGNREIDIVNESFVPSTEIWGVDTTACEMHQTDWTFAELQGGGIFNLMEGQSAYRALLTNYGNLICKNPGGCIRIKNAITA